MLMRVLLIDDEEHALLFLEKMLNKIEGIEIVGKYTNADLAFEDVISLQVDLVFLDMEMGNVHGLDVAREIISKYRDIEIVFVTAYPQFAFGAFEVNAIDYILKPVQQDRLQVAINKVAEKLELYWYRKQALNQEKSKLTVHTLHSFKLFDFDDNVIKWRTRKVKELFIFLLQHQDDPVHKHFLIEELWPEMDVNKSTNLLHTTVYQLRKKLSDLNVQNAINYVNDHYVLTIELNSDLVELERLLTKEKLSSSNMKRLLDLYKGDYLEEEGYGWAMEKQYSIKRNLLRCFERYVADYEVNQEENYVVERCLEKMLELDFYNEKYMRLLMEYYGRTQNYQKQRDLFSKMRLCFEEDLEVPIPAELMKLYKGYGVKH